jgi:hypothetical protein
MLMLTLTISKLEACSPSLYSHIESKSIGNSDDFISRYRGPSKILRVLTASKVSARGCTLKEGLLPWNEEHKYMKRPLIDEPMTCVSSPRPGIAFLPNFDGFWYVDDDLCGCVWYKSYILVILASRICKLT